jgi:hypothetical protein
MTGADPVKLRTFANDCLEKAKAARDEVDKEAWRKLADDFLKLAISLEQTHKHANGA